jgi:formylglycine-generating enzyme required for sulfatase activity
VSGGTARSFSWTPSSDLPRCDVDAAAVKVVLTSYKAGTAPDYMVVDLSPVAVDRVAYYPGAEWLPGGLLENGDYRSSKLVMRHIYAKGATFRMGSLGEAGRSADEYAHTVTLTNDFWLGVFEATYAQFNLFGAGVESVRPLRNIAYNTLRGNATEYAWPIKPSPDSYFGKIRAATGLPFDFPAEAQWEFASRAGYGEGRMGDGSLIVDLASDGSMIYAAKEQACYGKPWSKTDCSVIGGSFKPNAWGLYDMYGNESEYCVDWYKVDISANVNGEVVTEGDRVMVEDKLELCKIVRGGCFSSAYNGCRSAERNYYMPLSNKHEAGFRLYSTYGFQDEALVDAE